MSLADELIALEHEGWAALAAPGGAAYYERRLAADALMAFPFGVLDRAQALAAMASAPPWASHELSDVRVVALTPDSGTVLYAVEAQRDGQPPFRAVVGSTYVRRDGEWLLAIHQQSFGS